MKKINIVLGVTGSIAAYKACDIIRRLQDFGHDVAVIMTSEAKEFVTPLTFATLSRRAVYSNMFENAPIGRDCLEGHLAHISLASWANVLLIAPATANIIGKISNGIADDLLTCTAITTKAPIIIAPAMNDNMWANKIVQLNIEKLRQNGVLTIVPKEAQLACGDVGQGALADIAVIIQTVNNLLNTN